MLGKLTEPSSWSASPKPDVPWVAEPNVPSTAVTLVDFKVTVSFGHNPKLTSRLTRKQAYL